MEQEFYSDIGSRLKALDFAFTAKPLVFGGAAMQFYGLRKRGRDIDAFVSDEDYAALAAMHPQGRKDSWGDLGVAVGEFEIWRSIWKLDYAFFAEGAIEFGSYRILSIEKLLLTKALALNSPEKQKQEADMQLIVQYILRQNQRPDIVEFMNAHVQSYLNSPDGFVYDGKYEFEGDHV
jgi:hypothetical protein